MDRHGFVNEFALRLQMAEGIGFASGAEPGRNVVAGPGGTSGR
jgi:hypothetical protein